MAKSFNTKAKSLIRNEWCKPILNFLKVRANKKLLYLGLPSPAAEDIDDWIEHIDEVIAFQCREYGKPSDVNQSRKEIEDLEKKLNGYERSGMLNTFTVYDGYIEEVVLRGVDNISKEFTQSNTVRVYNLDFCNSITSPLTYVDKDGNIKEAYKFNAVKSLLRRQSELPEQNQDFIIFLTIHASFKGKELQNFVHNPDTAEHRKLIKNFNTKKGVKKKSRILKLFVIDTLQNYFRENNFVPHFLPTILYKGLKDTQLLHFTVFGFKEKPNTGRATWLQEIGKLCEEKFITTNEDIFETIDDDTLVEMPVDNIDSIKIFQDSKSFKKIWTN